MNHVVCKACCLDNEDWEIGGFKLPGDGVGYLNKGKGGSIAGDRDLAGHG